MATETKTQANPIQMLKQDHRKVLDLFKEFSELGDTAYKTKQKIAETVFQELELHTQLEEQVFYPTLREKVDDEGEELVEESYEEHHVVDLLIAELKQMTTEDERFDAKFTVLCENVQHHIEEEEQEMFPDAQRRLGDEMEMLGQRMLRKREELKAQLG